MACSVPALVAEPLSRFSNQARVFVSHLRPVAEVTNGSDQAREACLIAEPSLACDRELPLIEAIPTPLVSKSRLV